MDNRIGTLLTPDIMAELDKLWPDRCPDVRASDKQMLIAAAQRDVINTLWIRWRAINDPPPQDDN